jgi:Ca2+:H+ antiporter
MSRPLLYLLIAVPIAIILRVTGIASPIVIFVVSAIGLIPLAGLIGAGTEELAHYTGPRIGGLLNATLGNAAELIITIFAIREGLLELVKASITGSILGNLLLVLGMSLVAGGLRNGTQKFDRRQAGLNATLLVLAVIVLLIPSIFDSAFANVPQSELAMNEGVALVIIILYALTILYGFTSREAPEDISDHTPQWTARTAALVLVGATIGTAIMSEILVGSVEAVVQSLHLTEFFLGIIIIPLIGNVAEHYVAVQMAMKNKMEISLAVSLGSSQQIALFVAPVLVFISLIFGQRLLLVFTPYELIALVSASAIAAFISQDGESNWLEGAMLLALYVIVGLAFYFLPARG